MQHSLLASHHGRNSLIQWSLFWLVLVVIVLALWQPLLHIYQLWMVTQAGLVINGFILLLFVVGMLRIAWLLNDYRAEESALRVFVDSWVSKREIHGDSLIAGRYYAMQGLHAQQAPVHQGALAAALQAREKARTSVLRYINNVLILCGVFGTIVSLSIALVGASGMLEGAVDAQGMGMVIHGMSTALSTTMTAIACYFFFHYFLLLVENARMAVLANIEHLSTTMLAPAFHVQAEHLPYQLSELIQAMRTQVGNMAQWQNECAQQQQQAQQRMDQQLERLGLYLEQCTAWIPEGDVAEQSRQLERRLLRTMQELYSQQQHQHEAQLTALNRISDHLTQGFRLSDSEDE